MHISSNHNVNSNKESNDKNKDTNKEWRSYWIDDTNISHCSLCNTSFKVRTRKHHCRLCGGVFCGQCTSTKTPIHELEYTHPVRVCYSCFKVITSRALSYSPSIDTQLHAIIGLEKEIRWQSKSQNILFFVSSCLQQIVSDHEYHSILSENNIIDIIMHIISFSLQKGRFLGSIIKDNSKKIDSEIEESFTYCRNTLTLICKSLFILSTNDEIKPLFSKSLEKLLKLCFSNEIVLTDLIHDLLLQSVLEIALDDNICNQFFSYDSAINLIISVSVNEEHDTIQILALSVLLKIAQKGKNKRKLIIEKGALKVICNLLSESAKGPQRRIAIQFLLETAADESARMLLVEKYNVIPILINLLFNKQGLKEKSQLMISQALGIIGEDKYQSQIITEIENVLNSISVTTLNDLQKKLLLNSIHSLGSSDWLHLKVKQSSIIINFVLKADTRDLSSSQLSWLFETPK